MVQFTEDKFIPKDENLPLEFEVFHPKNCSKINIEVTPFRNLDREEEMAPNENLGDVDFVKLVIFTDYYSV